MTWFESKPCFKSFVEETPSRPPSLPPPPPSPACPILFPHCPCCISSLNPSMQVQEKEKDSAFAEKSKDAFEESDDESAISRTESELREVTKVRVFCPASYV